MASKFSKFDLSALLDLRDEIDTNLGGLRKSLMAQLASLGIGGLAPRDQKPSKRKVHPLAGRKAGAKFKDPETGTTWAGRGMTPKWLAAHEKAGRSRDAIGNTVATKSKLSMTRGRKPGRQRKKA